MIPKEKNGYSYNESTLQQFRESLGGFKLEGMNLSRVDAKFALLSENIREVLPDIDSETENEVSGLLHKLETFYLYLYEQMQNVQIKPLDIANNKVVIPDGILSHRTLATLDQISKIGEGGVLASEWFGQLESECEGRYCSFFTKKPNKNEVLEALKTTTVSGWNIRDKNLEFNPRVCEIILFFDTSNQLIQDFLKCDFFEFADLLRKKDKNFEEVRKTFPKDFQWLVDVYKNIIYPLSPAGRDMRSLSFATFYDWIAIPGGLPPQIINGVCINSEIVKNAEKDEKAKELLSQITKSFPHAVVFDENYNVIMQPQEQSITEKFPQEKNDLPTSSLSTAVMLSEQYASNQDINNNPKLKKEPEMID